jgi:hypothetical protein
LVISKQRMQKWWCDTIYFLFLFPVNWQPHFITFTR